MVNLGWVFMTGLLAGGISCVAVQGGLLTTAVAGKEGKAGLADVIYFLVSKLGAYVILGFVLGALGSAVKFRSRRDSSSADCGCRVYAGGGDGNV